MNKLMAYVRASLQEVRKVTWPTRKETYRYTVLVVVISLGVALFLGGLDYVFNLGLQAIISQ